MPANLFLIFGTAFVIGLSGAIMPGPVLAVSIKEAAQRGARAGPLLVLGHAIVEIAIIIALVWGLSEFLEQKLVAGIIGVLGGTFLLIMAFTILRQSQRAVGPLDVSATPVKQGRWLILTGALLSIANPFWFLWWATVGTTWVLWSWSLAAGIIGVVVFFFGHILSDLGWYSAITFAVARGKKFMSARIYRGLLLVCGIILIGLGVYFVYSGATFLAEA